MQVVDANVLLYSVNEDASRHEESRTWVDGALSGAATVGLPWISLLAFVRLATKSGVFPRPLSVGDALDQVDAWLAAPTAVAVAPTTQHATVLRRLLDEAGVGGNLTNDAHLAALALEHRGELVSWDADFARFPSVRWVRPA